MRDTKHLESFARQRVEKEKELAFHQTGRNSGVIHSGLYYKPGSLRATNCVAGRHALVDFAKKHRIRHDICGKLVVATNQKELFEGENVVMDKNSDHGVGKIIKIQQEKSENTTDESN